MDNLLNISVFIKDRNVWSQNNYTQDHSGKDGVTFLSFMRND